MRRTDQRSGVRRSRQGWRAYFKAGGRVYTRRFPITATLRDMQAWRQARRAEVIATLPAKAPKPAAARITFLTDDQKADVLAIVSQAIHGQATAGVPVLDGVRRALDIPAGNLG